MATTTINLRVSIEWERRVANALNILAQPLRADRSELIRIAMDEEEILYCHSPYIAMKALFFILVTRDGTLHYWTEEWIRLLERRLLLPFSTYLKPPTRKYYLDTARTTEDLKSRWLLNYFAARDEGQEHDSPRADDVDNIGLLEKAVDLRIDRGEGVPLIRERFAILDDFVRNEVIGDTSPENAGVPIEIPTLDCRIHLLVDRDLYADDPILYRSARVGYDFRNLDGARFQRDLLGFGNNEATFYGDVFPEKDADYSKDSAYKETLAAVRESAGRYFERLQHLITAEARTKSGHPIVADDDVRRRLQETPIPKRFLFGEFRWPKPYIGTVVNVTWNRPRNITTGG